jgi:hypothetical protein
MSSTLKPKKVMTPEQLEKLKVAREKALEVRRKNAEDKKLIKELADTEKQKVISEVKEKLYKLKEPVKEPPAIKQEPKVEIIEADPPKADRNQKKKIVIEQHSSDDENDHEVVYIRKKKEPTSSVVPQNIITQATQPIHQLPPRPNPYQRHYETMFDRNPNFRR